MASAVDTTHLAILEGGPGNGRQVLRYGIGYEMLTEDADGLTWAHRYRWERRDLNGGAHWVGVYVGRVVTFPDDE